MKLAQQLTDAKALQVTETALHTAAKVNQDAADGVALPFKTAFDAATLAHKTQMDMVTDADAAIAANATKLGEVLLAKTTASGKVDATDALIVTLNAEIVKQEANVTQHEEEKTTVDAALKVKTDATAVKTGLDTTA